MIDTKELRQKISSVDIVDHVDIHANVRSVLTELINRLEEAESYALEHARLNGMGASREAALMARLEAAEKERDAMRAKIETAENHYDRVFKQLLRERKITSAMTHNVMQMASELKEMEKQEPVGEIQRANSTGNYINSVVWVPMAVGTKLYALPGAQQCKNCNGMGDRFDPSGEKIPCDLCESNLEEIRVLVAEAAHDIVSGSDFWLSTSLAAKKICALPGAKGEEK